MEAAPLRLVVEWLLPGEGCQSPLIRILSSLISITLPSYALHFSRAGRRRGRACTAGRARRDVHSGLCTAAVHAHARVEPRQSGDWADTAGEGPRRSAGHLPGANRQSVAASAGNAARRAVWFCTPARSPTRRQVSFTAPPSRENTAPERGYTAEWEEEKRDDDIEEREREREREGVMPVAIMSHVSAVAGWADDWPDCFRRI